MIDNAVMRRRSGRRGLRKRTTRTVRYAALTAVIGAVSAMVLTTHDKACAAAGVAAQSSGALAAGTRFYVDPSSAAAFWDSRNPGDPREPAIAHRIADVSVATWFTSYDPGQIGGRVAQVTGRAAAEGTVPVLVLYDIPEVGCSTGSGAPSVAAYESWVGAFASGLGGHTAIVVVEPDALSLQTCLNAQQAADRDGAIAAAGATVHKADPNARVYFDAGNSAWNSPSVQAQRLKAADVATSANGIVSNVSNFRTTADEVNYDEQVLDALGNPSGLHIVVDTSRNGNGPGNTWCDPAGRALGQSPTANTGNPLVDAYLWIKGPGQADGCAAAAGSFVPQIAYGLIADGPGGAGVYAEKAPSPAAISRSAGPKPSADATTQQLAAATKTSSPTTVEAAKPYAGCDG